MTTDNIKIHKNQDLTFHISKAKRNERFYRKHDLDKSTFNEWAVVTLFYSSLHYIDAMLSLDTDLPDKLRDPDRHDLRKQAISQCKSLLPIAREYFELSDRSREARYSQTFFREGILNDIKTNLFEPIQNHVRKHLGISLEAES
jgi:hypothetical protein